MDAYKLNKVRYIGFVKYERKNEHCKAIKIKNEHPCPFELLFMIRNDLKKKLRISLTFLKLIIYHRTS
jgi:hypothetical protein